MNTPHSEETRVKIGQQLAETKRARPDSGSIIVTLFGKPPKALDAVEWARYRRLTKTTSYYRRHERNKAQARKNASWVKLDILQVMGWPAACDECGYDKYIGALDFHHLDPHTKDGTVTTVEEARKCRLLCANCHREAHADGKGKRTQGRPCEAADPMLEAYMRLSGLSDDVIARAMAGRPEREKIA